MERQHEELFKDISLLVSKGSYDEASKKLAPFKELKNKYVMRCRYLLVSQEKSPYYNLKDAELTLDDLDRARDTWGTAEKGRCLLYGEIYNRDPYAAEDTLRRVMEDDLCAKYFVALIHSRGMLAAKNEDPQDFIDHKEAIKLLAEIYRSPFRYRNDACLEFARLMMSKDDMTVQERTQVFGTLSHMLQYDVRGVDEMFVQFLLSEMGRAVDKHFHQDSAPSDMDARILFERSRSSVQSAVRTMQEEFAK